MTILPPIKDITIAFADDHVAVRKYAPHELHLAQPQFAA